MVVSQNFSSATSLAMLAPINTFTGMPSRSPITSEMSFSPLGPSSIPWAQDGAQARRSLCPLRASHLEILPFPNPLFISVPAQRSCCHPNPARACGRRVMAYENESIWKLLQTLISLPLQGNASPPHSYTTHLKFPKPTSIPVTAPNQLLFHIPHTSLLLTPPAILWTPPKLPDICLQTDLCLLLNQPPLPSGPQHLTVSQASPKPLLSSFQKTLGLLLP